VGGKWSGWWASAFVAYDEVQSRGGAAVRRAEQVRAEVGADRARVGLGELGGDGERRGWSASCSPCLRAAEVKKLEARASVVMKGNARARLTAALAELGDLSLDKRTCSCAIFRSRTMDLRKMSAKSDCAAFHNCKRAPKQVALPGAHRFHLLDDLTRQASCACLS
jgi:hypothetical protein